MSNPVIYQDIPQVTVLIRDLNYNVIAEAVNFTSLSATLRYNDVGEWTMEIPANEPEVPYLLLTNNPNGGIVIQRGDQIFFSGPILSHSWKMSADDGFPRLVVIGADDNYALGTRVIYPDPEVATFESGEHYFQVASTNTESIMRTLVSKNLSSDAPLAIRRYRGLTQNTNGNLGKVQKSVTFRFDLLLEVLQKLSIVAPNDSVVDADGNVTNPGDETKTLGFRVVQVGTGLQFQVYPLAVRENAILSFDSENLAEAEYNTRVGTGNFMIVGVGGQEDAKGKNIAAALYPYSRPDTYYPGRIEQYVDGGSLDEAVDGKPAIDQIGLTALNDNSGQISASITPIDTDLLRYGVDYNLGDYVAPQFPFLNFTSPIRSATLTVDSDGQKLALGIGTADGAYTAKTTGAPRDIQKLRSTVRRIVVAS